MHKYQKTKYSSTFNTTFVTYYTRTMMDKGKIANLSKRLQNLGALKTTKFKNA